MLAFEDLQPRLDGHFDKTARKLIPQQRHSTILEAAGAYHDSTRPLEPTVKFLLSHAVLANLR